jgi:tetratricopeptide (TPR) repeat protein
MLNASKLHAFPVRIKLDSRCLYRGWFASFLLGCRPPTTVDCCGSMPSFNDLIAELKRRRVFRVAGAYLVGAWIVLQVADTLFPALRFPPWTVTAVAVAVVLGFPIALVLGWLFDLTPGGIERTLSTTSVHFPKRAAIVGSLLVALGVGAFIGVRHRLRAARVDANAVVVMPFRVVGDPNLALMREGMVDLLAAKLSGEGGARAIDSRTTLAAWRDKVKSAKDDLPPLQAMQLARGLGAGQVLLGEMVGASGKVSLHATLYSAVTGAKIETVDDTASSAAVLTLVDRVVAKLLAQQAGQADRLEALLSESLPAVKLFLDGQRLYRRGEFDNASKRFKTALDEDSTFALAALALSIAREWSGYGPDWERGRKLAWQYRERLPKRDRDYINAMMADYPVASGPTKMVRQWEALTAASPDRVEGWYQLGDVLYHYGDWAGVDSAMTRALHAWSRAAALDSLYSPALQHQIVVYAIRGDTAQVRKVADVIYGRLRPDAKYSEADAWVAATALQDQPWLNELRKHVNELGYDEAWLAATDIVRGGLAHTDVAMLHEHEIKRATSAKDRAIYRVIYAQTLLNFGRPAAALATLSPIKDDTDAAEHAFWVLATALVWPSVDTSATASAARTLSEWVFSRPAGKVNQDLELLEHRCILETWRVEHGEEATARQTIALIRRLPADAWRFAACADHLEALLKVRSRAPDARAALASVDSLLRHSGIAQRHRQLYTLYAARGFQQLGDNERAYRAIMRNGAGSWGRSTILLEQARLAAATKRRDEAISLYQRFLKMQSNPEPGAPAQLVARVRAELAALVDERG